jgi:hypothetical protein
MCASMGSLFVAAEKCLDPLIEVDVVELPPIEVFQFLSEACRQSHWVHREPMFPCTYLVSDSQGCGRGIIACGLHGHEWIGHMTVVG